MSSVVEKTMKLDNNVELDFYTNSKRSYIYLDLIVTHVDCGHYGADTEKCYDILPQLDELIEFLQECKKELT